MKKEEFKITLISLQKDADRVPPSGLVYLATYLNERARIPKENIQILDNNYNKIEEELIKFNQNAID